MTAPVDLLALRTQPRADAIHAAAKSELLSRLWTAALGSGDTGTMEAGAPTGQALDLLLATMAPQAGPQEAATTTKPEPPRADATALPASAAAYAPVLQAAAERTGVPAAALAAIVQAEAGGANGRWNSAARNPHSSATGLGQFLAGTWIGEAERAGTYLNDLARRSGMLDGQGRVLPSARQALLDLRLHGATSIQAVADYATANLRSLGVGSDASAPALARAAYLGHHLGIGDARRYLASGLGDARAAMLLRAQVGAGAANAAIAEAGNASAAHRNWLERFIGRKVLGALGS